MPRIIHQTWKTEVIPEKWVAARQSCMDMHPGYEFRLWTDDSAREVLAKEMPQLLPTYDSYIYSIERADAIRCAPALPCKFLKVQGFHRLAVHSLGDPSPRVRARLISVPCQFLAFRSMWYCLSEVYTHCVINYFLAASAITIALSTNSFLMGLQHDCQLHCGGRYALLYLYGGFYMDLDIECRRPLDFLRAYPFVMPQTRPVGFSNDFLAAAPGHPFVAQLLAALPRWNLWLLSKYPTVMFSTGPMFVTLQASLYRSRRSLWVLPDRLYGKYVPAGESLFVHLFGSSWHGDDAKSALWLVHHPLLLLGAGVLSAVACALYLWRRSCTPLGAGQAQSDLESAALKMC